MWQATNKRQTRKMSGQKTYENPIKRPKRRVMHTFHIHIEHTTYLPVYFAVTSFRYLTSVYPWYTI